jgi:hypothetical protein
MWFVQAERLKYKANQMTVKEAMELVWTFGVKD